MISPKLTRVKICCIASPHEVKIAVASGASALGLVSEMPSGPGPIPEVTIAECVKATPPGVANFLLTSLSSVEAVIAQLRRTGAGVVQLVDYVPTNWANEIRSAMPSVKIVQVIHVLGEETLEVVGRYAPISDALLLDSGNPFLATKELGGTGRRHDWSISRRIVEECGLPVYLAGGLNSSNVVEAIETVGPFGLDLCSGVRTNGDLDPVKLEAFFGAVRSL